MSAAVGSGSGLLDATPFVSPATSRGDPSPHDPPPPSRIRWRTGRRAAALLCLLALALLGWFWWQTANGAAEVAPLSSMSAEATDVQAPEPESESMAGTDESPGKAEGETPGNVIVHVAGAVRRAGIVELPRGSRLHEAIEAAGGSAPDADSDQLNLAAVLEDGQKVLVPRKGETLPSGAAPAGGTGGGGGPLGPDGSSAAAGKININTAGVEQLATLPRVGPVLAQRIVEWRGQHGKFQRVEELDAVDGVGPKMLAALLPLVRV
ncbi:helix-hairpin-helix domain-containing protein [Arthrobacter sp. Leaf69]|uniref:helix-hairpin-helix domain-containing protein n=1 Tax=Arthrobacter sp. Leaf69 TaxID=1736232 RepID=UPI000B253642|nr:helix-hairpin-helix domain-containing protein [Arthrobacter sp. Leaf69]